MFRSVLVSLATLATLHAQSSGITTQCRWDSGRGTSFDLSSMQIAPGGYYKVLDMRNPSTSYYFNVCADISPPDASCTRTSNAYSTAFQVENPTNPYCYRVGGPAALGWNFSLYDQVRPARGVRITFLNGENQWCPTTNGIPNNRTFTVELLCANVAPQSNYGDASVFELNNCDYRMQLKSIAGCPLQCVSSGSICSGHGVCGFDTDAGASRCYCYTGYQGNDCGTATADSGGLSTESIILIIVCIVLCGVIGLVTFMFLKLRKLQVDPAAYGELQGRFNELGMLA